MITKPRMTTRKKDNRGETTAADVAHNDWCFRLLFCAGVSGEEGARFLTGAVGKNDRRRFRLIGLVALSVCVCVCVAASIVAVDQSVTTRNACFRAYLFFYSGNVALRCWVEKLYFQPVKRSFFLVASFIFFLVLGGLGRLCRCLLFSSRSFFVFLILRSFLHSKCARCWFVCPFCTRALTLILQNDKTESR